jgi:hypothetical protein
MLKLAMLLAAALTAATPLQAQDIVGLEDCAKASRADKKSGCLQANVAFLHGLIKKNDTSAQAQSKAAAARIDELHGEIARLKLALEQLEKKMPRK